MTTANAELTILETVLNDVRAGVQEELDFQNGKGWNHKGLTLEDMGGELFLFAVHNLEGLNELSAPFRMMMGSYIVISKLYGAENIDAVGDYEWDTAALGL